MQPATRAHVKGLRPATHAYVKKSVANVQSALETQTRALRTRLSNMDGAVTQNKTQVQALHKQLTTTNDAVETAAQELRMRKQAVEKQLSTLREELEVEKQLHEHALQNQDAQQMVTNNDIAKLQNVVMLQAGKLPSDTVTKMLLKRIEDITTSVDQLTFNMHRLQQDTRKELPERLQALAKTANENAKEAKRIAELSDARIRVSAGHFDDLVIRLEQLAKDLKHNPKALRTQLRL